METTNNNEMPKNDGSFKIKGDWNEQSKKLQKHYPQLTDADLKYESGKEHELLGRVGSRLNKKREEVVSIINTGGPEKI